VKVHSIPVLMMYNMCLAGFCPGILTFWPTNSNETRGPIVTVKSSHDVPREQL